MWFAQDPGGTHTQIYIEDRGMRTKPLCSIVIGTFIALAGCAGTQPLPERKPDTTTSGPQVLPRLSTYLQTVLVQGQLPPHLQEDETLIRGLQHSEFGTRADYQAWITDFRAYNRRLEKLQGYEPIPILRAWKDEPLDIPWRVNAWIRDMTDTPADVPGCLQQVRRLLEARTGRRFPDPATPGAEPDPTAGAMDRFTAAFLAAATAVDQTALGRITPDHRRLLRFVVPWICRTNGRFQAKSKGAPPYGFHWRFQPPDPFKPNDLLTSKFGLFVPMELGSQTGVYHFLRALAGQPVRTNGIMQDHGSPAAHPEFEHELEPAGYATALQSLAQVLGPDTLRELLAELTARDDTAADPAAAASRNHVVLQEQTRYGLILVGGSGPNVYDATQAAVIIDLAGDDEYRFAEPQHGIGNWPVTVILDFAGNDLYQSNGVGGPAAGILGIGLLVDRQGDDRYCQGTSAGFQPRAQSAQTLLKTDPEGKRTQIVPPVTVFGSPGRARQPGATLNAGFAFGAGFLGIGCLIDEAGNDVYIGQKYVFGAAMWAGIGTLHDRAGDDLYVAGLASIGVGINAGIGLLHDRSGQDHYQCLGLHESGYSTGKEWDNGFDGAGIGYGSSWRAEARDDRPAARWQATFGGGIGIVRDRAGDDSYVAGSFSVASGYAGGAGCLLDDNGNDTYFVKRGPGGINHSGWSGNHSLGNGCHRGVGLLLDRNGNDRYSASNLGGGTAWDLGIGFLLDLGGDDLLTDLHGKDVGGNTGWGAAKALGVSFHWGGTDHYERHGFADAAAIAPGYPGKGGNFSFFLDIGPERDQYPKDWPDNGVRLSGIAQSPETDGVTFPAGIGLFVDGDWPFEPIRNAGPAE